MINRYIQNTISDLLQYFPAVAILGPRQCGKTTLANSMLQSAGKPAVYLDLENPSDSDKLSNASHFFSENIDSLVIIDEIQRRPDLFPLLRSVIDSHRVPGRFLLLGSASPRFLWQSNETLAGRISYQELTPFLFEEIRYIGNTSQHWFKGGFPLSFLAENDTYRREWLRSFINSYIERDLSLLGLEASPELLRRFLELIAHMSGQILNKAGLSKSLEIRADKIRTILGFFESSYMIRILPSYHYNHGKRLVKSPKIYIRDSGLLHAILRINDYNSLLGHPVLGHSWEGYIIEQIINTFGTNDFNYYFYRTSSDAECDLVIEKGLEIAACVEIKFTDTPSGSRGLTQSVFDLRSKNNFIIVPDCKSPYTLKHDIIVCSLIQFFVLFKKTLHEEN